MNSVSIGGMKHFHLIGTAALCNTAVAAKAARQRWAWSLCKPHLLVLVLPAYA